MQTQTHYAVDYFDGTIRLGFWDDDDFNCTWTGTVNNSASTVRANRSILGSSANRVIPVLSNNWASKGTKSMRLIPAGTGLTSIGDNYTVIEMWPMGLQEGKTYTLTAYGRQSAAMQGAANSGTQGRNLFLVITGGGGTFRGFGQTAQHANAAGVYKHTITFTVPNIAGDPVTALGVRFYCGHNYGAGDIFWDEVTLVEGIVSEPYFDGDDTHPDPRVPDLWSWDGTPHASSSTRLAFAADPGGLPLKRFIASMSDQAGDVAATLERFHFFTPDDGGVSTDTSDLVNSLLADAAWLPWLAQMVGAARAVRNLDTTQQRLALQNPGRTAGAAPAIASAAQAALSGDKFVNIYARTTNVSALFGGGQWDVLIVTRVSETVGNPVQAVIDAGAKPAGVVLWHRTFETTWDDLEATYSTWAAIDALPNWTALEETGL